MFPKGVNTESLIRVIREISWESANIFKSYIDIERTNSELKKKLEINNFKTGPVTSADLEVNKIIIDGIKKNFPNQNWFFLSEESNKDAINYQLNEWVWIIDPLDGTKDFINRTGEYATHISLTYKKKNILGAVLIASKNELWLYLDGKGSWCENSNFKKKKYTNVNKNNFNEIRILVSRSHRYPELDRIITKLNPAHVIGMGSIGYKITALIRDEADFYITYSEKNKSCPKDWDMAAPAAIIKGLGGNFTDIDSNELTFLKDDEFRQSGILIASMREDHNIMCNKIKELLN